MTLTKGKQVSVAKEKQSFVQTMSRLYNARLLHESTVNIEHNMSTLLAL